MRWQMRFVVAILGACVLASGGCVSSNSMAVGDRTYPPRPKNYIIDVYLDQSAPVQVHKELTNTKPLSAVPPDASTIGRVDTSGAMAATWGAVVNDAKLRARALGGDGLVITGWGSPITGVGSYGQVYYGKSTSMNVIRYRQ